jgi:hypothetical protein
VAEYWVGCFDQENDEIIMQKQNVQERETNEEQV